MVLEEEEKSGENKYGITASLLFFFFYYLFIRLHRVLVAALGIFVAPCGIFDCGSWTLVVVQGLSSCETGGKGTGHSLSKNDLAQGHNIN